MSPAADQYDSPWKEALELYLRSILELCFPQVARAIDWHAGLEFLDQELQEIVRDAALGPQRVDKLVKVRLRNGAEEWILIHIEVQHRPEHNLPLRVYQYHHRTRDRFGTRVLSLVMLADSQPTWRPCQYVEEILGCRVQFDFPVCKLLDLVEVAQQAMAAGQPSAVMVVANWAAQHTRRNMAERRRWKWELTRRLYESGLRRQDILELYRLIDWMLRLPQELEQAHREQVRNYEQEKVMRYVTSIERMAKEEGIAEGLAQGQAQGLAQGQAQGLAQGQAQGLAQGQAQGLAQGQAQGLAQGRAQEGMELVLRLLRRRLGALTPELEQRVRGLQVDQLESLAEALLDFTGPVDLKNWLNQFAY